MFALFDLLDEFRPNKLGAADDAAMRFGAKVKAFHQIVAASRQWILAPPVELRSCNQRLQFLSRRRSTMNHGNCVDSRSFQKFKTGGQVEKDLPVLVVNVELEKIVRQPAVVD